MSKNILKRDTLYIASTRSVYLKIIALLIFAIIMVFIFILLGNKFVIYNSKDVYKKNIELNAAISDVKLQIKQKKLYENMIFLIKNVLKKKQVKSFMKFKIKSRMTYKKLDRL